MQTPNHTWLPSTAGPQRPLARGGGRFSTASATNDAGQVVGYCGTAERDYHAFITGPDGKGIRDLGTLGGFSNAHSINDAGQVTGISSAGNAQHPFITGPDGMGMRDLDPSDIFSGGAQDINDAGQVVSQDGGSRRAFITGPDGMGMRDLGTFGGIFPFNASEAFGINDTGEVVGKSFATAEGLPAFHAFVTGPDGTGMMDLNSLVDPPQGLIFDEAKAINNAGQVIATTSARPIPEPGISALFVAGLGLIGLLARRKKA